MSQKKEMSFLMFTFSEALRRCEQDNTLAIVSVDFPDTALKITPSQVVSYHKNEKTGMWDILVMSDEQTLPVSALCSKWTLVTIVDRTYFSFHEVLARISNDPSVQYARKIWEEERNDHWVIYSRKSYTSGGYRIVKTIKGAPWNNGYKDATFISDDLLSTDWFIVSEQRDLEPDTVIEQPPSSGTGKDIPTSRECQLFLKDNALRYPRISFDITDTVGLSTISARDEEFVLYQAVLEGSPEVRYATASIDGLEGSKIRQAIQYISACESEKKTPWYLLNIDQYGNLNSWKHVPNPRDIPVGRPAYEWLRYRIAGDMYAIVVVELSS